MLNSEYEEGNAGVTHGYYLLDLYFYYTDISPLTPIFGFVAYTCPKKLMLVFPSKYKHTYTRF